MARSDIRFQTVLKQARQLSPHDQRRLGTALLHSLREDGQIRFIPLRRFQKDVQARFQELMDRNSEGRLGLSEHGELEALVARHETLTFLNTEALLHATHPGLFGRSGRLIRKRLDHMLRHKNRAGP